MTYDTIIKDLCEQFEFIKTEYDKQVSDGSLFDPESPYLFAECVLVRFIDENINKDSKELNELLTVLNEMSNSEDNEVGEVCDFGVIESLCGKYKDNVLDKLFSGYSGLEESKRYTRAYILEP